MCLRLVHGCHGSRPDRGGLVLGPLQLPGPLLLLPLRVLLPVLRVRHLGGDKPTTSEPIWKSRLFKIRCNPNSSPLSCFVSSMSVTFCQQHERYTLAVKTPLPSEPLLSCIVSTILDSMMPPPITFPCPILSAASEFPSSNEGRDPPSNVGHAD